MTPLVPLALLAARLAAPAPEPAPILYGDLAAGKWPSVVGIVASPPVWPPEAELCTGALVAPQVILTAAHCLLGVSDPADISVYFGDTAAGASATVTDFGLHPDACVDDCDDDALDFAFIVFAEEAMGAEPIPLLVDQGEWDATTAPGQPAVVVGFGATRNLHGDDDEYAADEIKHKREATLKVLGATAGGFELLLGDWPKDICGGDSGGPAFVQLADGAWRQVGVLSRGSTPCGESRSYWGVPFHVLPWLRDMTGADLLPPGCEDATCLDTTPPITPDDCNCSTPSTRGALPFLALLALAPRRRARRR